MSERPERVVVRGKSDARFAWRCLGPLALGIWLAVGGGAALAARGHPAVVGAALLAYARRAWRVEVSAEEVVAVTEGLSGSGGAPGPRARRPPSPRRRRPTASAAPSS